MTLEEAALASASLRLFDKVLASSYDPTHIVAIASGGVHVAKPMPRRADPFGRAASRPKTAFLPSFSGVYAIPIVILPLIP